MMTKVETPYGEVPFYEANPSGEGAKILVVPGFSETITHNKALADALGRRGYRSMTFTQPKRRKIAEDIGPIEYQGRVVCFLLDACLENDEKVHGVVHSLGGPVMLKAFQIAILERKNHFASLQLHESAGVTGRQGIGRLAIASTGKLLSNHKRALKPQDPERQLEIGYRAAKDTEPRSSYSRRVLRAHLSGGRIFMHPVLSIQEAKAAGSHNARRDMAVAAALGTAAHIVTAPGDEFFGQERFDANYSFFEYAAASYSVVADAGAGHDTFWMQPERTAEIVDQILELIRE